MGARPRSEKWIAVSTGNVPACAAADGRRVQCAADHGSAAPEAAAPRAEQERSAGGLIELHRGREAAPNPLHTDARGVIEDGERLD